MLDVRLRLAAVALAALVATALLVASARACRGGWAHERFEQGQEEGQALVLADPGCIAVAADRPVGRGAGPVRYRFGRYGGMMRAQLGSGDSCVLVASQDLGPDFCPKERPQGEWTERAGSRQCLLRFGGMTRAELLRLDERLEEEAVRRSVAYREELAQLEAAKRELGLAKQQRAEQAARLASCLQARAETQARVDGALLLANSVKARFAGKEEEMRRQIQAAKDAAGREPGDCADPLAARGGAAAAAPAAGGGGSIKDLTAALAGFRRHLFEPQLAASKKNKTITGTLAQCTEACKADPLCTGFARLKAAGPFKEDGCMFLSDQDMAGKMTKSKKLVTFVRTDGASVDAYAPLDAYVKERNVPVLHEGGAPFVSTLEQCLAKCDTSRDCVGVTIEKKAVRAKKDDLEDTMPARCFLKQGLDGPVDFKNRDFTTFVKRPAGKAIMHPVDANVVGNTMHKLTGTAAECRTFCEDTPACVAFTRPTFTAESASAECWFKKKIDAGSIDDTNPRRITYLKFQPAAGA